MSFASHFDRRPPSAASGGSLIPAGAGPVASMQRLLLESFDSETCGPLARCSSASNGMEHAISLVSRFSGVAMLGIAYIGTVYFATGLI